jgi:hypothetical protein
MTPSVLGLGYLHRKPHSRPNNLDPGKGSTAQGCEDRRARGPAERLRRPGDGHRRQHAGDLLPSTVRSCSHGAAYLTAFLTQNVLGARTPHAFAQRGTSTIYSMRVARIKNAQEGGMRTAFTPTPGDLCAELHELGVDGPLRRADLRQPVPPQHLKANCTGLAQIMGQL